MAGCDGVLTVLVPRGVHGYSTGTAQAVLDLAPPGARLVFSCGWHITRDGQDVYSRRLKWEVGVLGGFGKLVRAVDLDDQVEACRRVFASDTRWTVVRGSELEDGESQGLPVRSWHVGDPIVFQESAAVTLQQIGSAMFHDGEENALAQFKREVTPAGDGWIENIGGGVRAFTLYERSDDWCATGFAYCARPQAVPRLDVAAATVDVDGIPAGHVHVTR